MFKKGHALRLEVSSSNFPRFDRNLNTGEDNGTGTAVRAGDEHDPARRAASVGADAAGRAGAMSAGSACLPRSFRRRDHDVAVVHGTVIALEQQRPGVRFGAVERAAGNPGISRLQMTVVPFSS